MPESAYDVMRRQGSSATCWIESLSFTIQAGHGCIGCAEDGLWDKGGFYNHLRSMKIPCLGGAELAALQRNFYGFDASYHVARHHFVHRKAQAWTPRHLARHR